MHPWNNITVKQVINLPNGLDIHSKSQTKVTNYLNENTEKNNLPVKTSSFKHKQIYEWPTKNKKYEKIKGNRNLRIKLRKTK